MGPTKSNMTNAVILSGSRAACDTKRRDAGTEEGQKIETGLSGDGESPKTVPFQFILHPTQNLEIAKMKRAVFALICVGWPSMAVTQSTEQAVGSITQADIYRHIEVMAHDSMRGRDTPSPELDLTAEYVASEFRRIGLEPGAENNSYIQRYPLTEGRRQLSVAIAGTSGWQPGADVVQRSGGGFEASGPLVLVTGAGEPSQPTEVEDAIVLVAAEWGGRGLSAPSQQLVSAVQAGNPAVVIIATDLPDRYWGYFSRGQNRSQVTLGSQTEVSTDAPLLLTRLATAQALLAHTGAEPSWEGQPTFRTLNDLTFDITASFETSPRSAPNVVGILEGSDPTLKDEYIVLSAHMDHIGMGTPVDGDSVNNGADDNASGTAAVIEAAEAFAMMNPGPKRSMIFLAVSGEEKGMWGSAHYSENPSVPISQIVADINTDMIGRNWTDTIVAIGKEYSDLGETLDRVNAEHPELNMAAIDDIWPDERFYYRSDHYSFAEKGVPVLFFFNGTHEDYHGVNDEIEKVDTEKATRIVKLMFYLSLEIANSPEKPKWKQTG